MIKKDQIQKEQDFPQYSDIKKALKVNIEEKYGSKGIDLPKI